MSLNDVDGWDDIKGGLDPCYFMTPDEFEKYAKLVGAVMTDSAYTEADERFLKEFVVRIVCATASPGADVGRLTTGMYGIAMAACSIGFHRAKEADPVSQES